MGYRSDITVVVYGNGCNAEKYETLKVLMATTFANVLKEWESDVEWNNKNKALIFRIMDVKWYDAYPEVQEFMSMLHTLSGELEFNYEMVRLGEEAEDVAFATGGEDVDYILRVERSAAINF